MAFSLSFLRLAFPKLLLRRWGWTLPFATWPSYFNFLCIAQGNKKQEPQPTLWWGPSWLPYSCLDKGYIVNEIHFLCYCQVSQWAKRHACLRSSRSPNRGDQTTENVGQILQLRPPYPTALRQWVYTCRCDQCEILVFKAILFLFMICRYFIHVPALEKRLPLWYPLTQPTIQLFHEVLKLVEQKQCVKY